MKKSHYKHKSATDMRRQRRSVLPIDFEETETILHQSDDSENEFPLHHKKEEHYVEKELQQGDTLQSLALDFNCSIAELKRINKIHRENEIFALRIVKIPIKPGSFIIEKLQSENDKQSIKENNLLLTESQIHCQNAREADAIDLCCRSPADSAFPSPPNDEQLKIFDSNHLVHNALNHLNNQSAKCVLKDNTQLADDRSDFEELDELPVLVQDNSLWRCSGDDCGLSWKPLLIFFLSLGLAGPLILIYIFYIAEKTHPT